MPSASTTSPEPRLLLDLSHTSHTGARTGIQRVARSLWQSLGAEALPITYDPHQEAWRTLDPWEKENLTSAAPATKRGAQWPLRAKLAGHARRLLDRTPTLPVSSGLLVPEVFSPAAARALPAILATTKGPRVAVFHDAIALKFPELSPAKTVARFPPYLIELLSFDGIAANSEDSQATLLDYWRWLGVKNPPPVAAIPLGIDLPSYSKTSDVTPWAATPVILSVGSIEGRKNHLALLDACERLWIRGQKFELHLIGLGQPQTGKAALERIEALRAAGRPLRYDGPVDDAALQAAYAACAFTVYPSIIEGFGLPVLESVAHGKPCICSQHGALGEAAREGGCMMLPGVDAGTLAPAIEHLLAHPAEAQRLAEAARGRTLKTWNRYAAEVVGWMRQIPRRSV